MVVPIATSFAPPNSKPATGSLPSRKPHLLIFPNRHTKVNPLVLWHLLSLDAPTVAAVWTWSIASANGIHLSWTSLAAMATAVWLLYAGDRLMDSRALTSAHAPGIEARHRFHHQHRRAFRIGIAAASIALAALLPALYAEAIHLYLIEGSFLAGYFLLIHGLPHGHRLPKEFAVGLFFAAATFIPTVARHPGLRVPLLAPALLFAALCTLNCLFIYSWEHPGDLAATAHITTRAALRQLRPITATLLLAALALTVIDPSLPWTIPAAIALSTTLLLVLNKCRRRLSPTTLRAAADVALLTPALFLLI